MRWIHEELIQLAKNMVVGSGRTLHKETPVSRPGPEISQREIIMWDCMFDRMSEFISRCTSIFLCQEKIQKHLLIREQSDSLFSTCIEFHQNIERFLAPQFSWDVTSLYLFLGCFGTAWSSHPFSAEGGTITINKFYSVILWYNLIIQSCLDSSSKSKT